MQILGPDLLVFGVDDMDACRAYLEAFGLRALPAQGVQQTFVALDGTGVVIAPKDDPTLPPALASGSMLRQQVYGVATSHDLVAITEQLGSERAIVRCDDGSIELLDDLGFALKFQVSIRRPLQLAPERINAPGAEPQRRANEIGVWEEMPAQPRTLSHVVLFVPNVERASAFYRDRLGFKVTDELVGAGPFLRPAGNDDHHTLFLIGAPPFMQGCEHLAFHMAGPTEVLVAGTRFVSAGYQSFWGPGRHKLGSNWFWYFNSPFGCHFEFDADMDKHDATWEPRSAPSGADASQIFLFAHRDKWSPAGGPS